MATALFLLAPETECSAKKIPIANKVDDLIHYRGGYRKVKKLARGGALGYLSNAGAIDEFAFGEFSGDELEMLVRIARTFGGEHLAVWSYGRSVHVMHVCAPTGEEPLIRELSLRIDAPRGGRSDAVFADFCGWFDGGAFRPDLTALHREYDAACIALDAWVKAFGVTGARDLDSAEPAAMWEDFDQVATTLLHGEVTSVQLVKRLNREIRREDEECALKTKPPKRKGATARLVSEAAYCLGETVGEPESERWQERRRAAGFYWDITDCEPARAQLTVGSDAKGLGISASLGRLMCHYPADLMRDGVFWSLAGLETESANGHAYTDAIHCFAEGAHEAGFTLAVIAADRAPAFRDALGICAFEEPAPSRHAFAAEAFVDLPKLLKSDPRDSVGAWFRAAHADGLCLRAESDGAFELEFFVAGEPGDEPPSGFAAAAPDATAVELAARRLDPRAMCRALGLPDLLAPGEWHEGAYASPRDTAAEDVERRETVAALADPPTARTVPDHRFLMLDDPPTTNRKQLKHHVNQFCVVLPESDTAWQRALKNDLVGAGLIADYGQAWVDGNRVWGYSRTRIEATPWLRALGDLPDGTEVLVRDDDADFERFTLDRSVEREAPWCHAAVEPPLQVEREDEDEELEAFLGLGSGAFCDALQRGLEDESWIVERVLGRNDRNYYGVDTSACAHPKLERIRELCEAIEGVRFRSEEGDRELRFIALGDLVCDQFDNVVMRAFCAPEYGCYVTIMIPAFGDPILEMYTALDDGTSITTTQNALMSGDKARGIRAAVVAADVSVADFWQQHRELVALQCRSGARPVPEQETLEGLAAAVDEFLDRQLGGS